MVLDSPFAILAQMIEAQTILLGVVKGQQTGAEPHPLLFGHNAFEDRELDALPKIETGATDFAQSGLPLLRRGVHIVADDHGLSQ